MSQFRFVAAFSAALASASGHANDVVRLQQGDILDTTTQIHPREDVGPGYQQCYVDGTLLIRLKNGRTLRQPFNHVGGFNMQLKPDCNEAREELKRKVARHLAQFIHPLILNGPDELQRDLGSQDLYRFYVDIGLDAEGAITTIHLGRKPVIPAPASLKKRKSS